jgi:hypothetical protein
LGRQAYQSSGSHEVKALKELEENNIDAYKLLVLDEDENHGIPDFAFLF